ncbi:GNAT family N-acetyltransferase [Alkalicoccobacillus plakortidis]|uniref:GNAT family N-acetyltransferase n=1 Tax=Alkalicoccobacillus plakortidis TaxID=444060 RepID=A0ABT0XE19_9BACI|nr:GNAT family N-acetyltransferase [Alkalicoccobacillus plakortidis]MCM2674137.1 GNAT family N-acetyltransferase [Alkalicoccobacillus plakortidis]
MERVKIRRPLNSDRQEIHNLFKDVIKDTFAREGLSKLVDDQQGELKTKIQYLKSDLENCKEKRQFLLAIDNAEDKIIGTIEYGKPNELIQNIINEDLVKYPEIGTIFVLPTYQGNHIGSKLIETLLKDINNHDFHGYCLDSGYRRSQLIWTKKFGAPNYVLNNYWGEANHHMVWKKDL